MKRIQIVVISVLSAALLLARPMQAQTSFSSQEQSRAAQYVLGSEDQVLMAVNVWGFVIKPGQYLVPYDTDLISLLSYAGGPREEAKIKNIKVVRAGKDATAQVIDVDVKKFLESGRSSEIPILRPGDTVIVNGTTFHFVSRFFEFAYRIAIIFQVWAFIQYYSKR